MQYNDGIDLRIKKRQTRQKAILGLLEENKLTGMSLNQAAYVLVGQLKTLLGEDSNTLVGSSTLKNDLLTLKAQGCFTLDPKYHIVPKEKESTLVSVPNEVPQEPKEETQ